jgi:TRAP-type C4-dicarboxylate transport system permease small subunit
MEALIHQLERATIRATRVIALIGLAALLILAIITMADVTMRWLANQPITGVDDIAKLVVAIAIGASIPAVLATRQNITIRFIGRALGRRAELVFEIFGSVVVLAIMAGMAWQIQIYTDELRQTGETTWLLGLHVAPFWQVVSVLLFLSVPIQIVVIAGLLVTALRGRRLVDHDLMTADADSTPQV